MKIALSLCAFLLPIAAIAESPIADQERAIVQTLRMMGYSQGYDADSGTFVALTHAIHRCDKDDCAVKLWAIHRNTYNESLSKARHDVEVALSGFFETSNTARRHHEGGQAYVSRQARYLASTDEYLIGYETLAMCGEWVDGAYLVTTAVAWSEKREAAAALSLSGETEAAYDWESQLRSYLESHTLETLPPYGSFADSNGFVHFFGAYAVDLSSARSSLKMNMLMKKMETRALANLQLASEGIAKSSASSSISTCVGADGTSCINKSLESSVEKGASGTIKPFRLILETDLPCELTGGKMHLIVYAYEPLRIASKAMTNDKADKPSRESRVKIWNPIANRFEEEK